MQGMLKKNQELTSTNKLVYRIIEKIGEGGQGEVYKVMKGKNFYALKWYFKHTATEKQRSIIENLIQKGPPDMSFLWPMDVMELDNQFGYIMPLRPNNYKNIVDLMKRRVEPGFRELAVAGFNLASGYRNLHSMGYSYCDISFGNLFFDPNTGDVLICDNDNVTVNGVHTGVLGTPRFMAPEIVTGEKRPSTDTDLYSMALLLFYMLMIHHPLEGAREAKIRALDIHAMNQLYGNKPLFIWDPVDKSNRPLKGYQDNAIIYWDLYPKFLKDLFMRSFTDGLFNPQKRVVEKEWLDAFARLMDSIIYCPRCGAEVFFDEAKREKGVGHICWYCQASVAVPPVLQIGKKTLLLNKDARLLSHHVKDDYNIRCIVGEVVQNPRNPSQWGIRNLSGEVWTYLKGDGTHLLVERNRTAAISKGASINFGVETGQFRI